MDLSIVAALASGLLGGLGGVWLDRPFQQLDLRRQAYVAWLEHTDRQFEAIHEGALADEPAISEFMRIESTAVSALRLLASAEVRLAVESYVVVYDEAFNTFEQAVERARSPRDVTNAVLALSDATDKGRDKVVTAMRADLRQRIWARRLQ